MKVLNVDMASYERMIHISFKILVKNSFSVTNRQSETIIDFVDDGKSWSFTPFLILPKSGEKIRVSHRYN